MQIFLVFQFHIQQENNVMVKLMVNIIISQINNNSNKILKNNQFVEYANVHGNLYGTSKQSIQNVAKKRQICLLEIDYQGAKTIKDLSGIDCHYIFITCNGGLETLTNRLKCRNTETEQQIEKRLKNC